MRITLFLLLVSVLQTIANDSYSQKTRFSLNFSNTKLEDVLDEIEERSEFYFLYNEKLVDASREVSISFNNQKIDEILNRLFEGTDVVYSIVDRKIILVPSYLSDNTVQQKTVSGTVADESGQPLPGVTVLVKGTTQGTVTNADGNYSLSNIPEDATLQFSFVGMLSQEIAVGDQTTINVTMQVNAIGIEEVVAIGYGTLRKQDITGSVAVADLEIYEKVPVNNVFESVKGTVSGLTVGGTNSAGQVGGLLIRGQNSPTASNAPLIVVDGVIFNGSLADLPSHDIENFTVLKDASAAAVYGARSGNGVILIETKTGSSINGKPKFFVNASHGLSNELKKLELLDAEGYIQRLIDFNAASTGTIISPDDVPTYLENVERDNYLATPDHQPTFSDPYGIMYQLGQNAKINLGVSQKNKNTDYYISVSLTDQKGVRVGDQYKNINGRLNITSELTDWFTFGIKSYYSRKDYSGVEVSSNFKFTSPYASFYNEDGSYRLFPQDNTSHGNPYLDPPNVNNNIQNTLNGIITGIIKVPFVKGLNYTVNYSNTVNWNNREIFYDETKHAGRAKSGIGSRSATDSHSYLLDQIINYKRVFADKHKVDLTLLYSLEESKSKSLWGEAENFVTTLLLDYGLESGLVQRVTAGGGESSSTGKMARLNYTFNDKYALTGTLREDGFSAFSEGKKMASFYSVGANWNVTNEGFLQNSKTINYLALRASYGKNGNPSVAPYSTLAKMSAGKYILGNDIVVYQGLSSLALSVFGWETTTALNLGVDFDLLEQRINGSLNAYKSKTNNLLFDRPLPSPAGTASLKDNVGEIENKGFELDLHTVNVQKNDFSWESNFVFSLNRNKIVTLTGNDNDGDGVEDDLTANGYFIGKPLGTVYGYKVLGIYQEDDEIPIETARTGEYILEDIDGDGQISSDKDRQILGETNPRFQWSFTNTFTYKNLSVMAYLYSIWGGNNYYLSTNNAPYLMNPNGNTAMNIPKWDYWTPTNTDAEFPSIAYNYAQTKAVKPIDRSFIKLQKVSVSYNLSDLVKQYGINALSVSLSADNLATYAPHWFGLDPETNQGITTGAVPSIRTYLLGVTFEF